MANQSQKSVSPLQRRGSPIGEEKNHSVYQKQSQKSTSGGFGEKLVLVYGFHV
jgi:hypothetical protein